MKRKIWYAVTLLTLLTACNSEGVSEYERTTAIFQQQIGGRFDESQSWETAVKLKVMVFTESPVEIYAFSTTGKDKILYDYKKLLGRGEALMTIPQGYGNDFVLMCVGGGDVYSKRVELDGRTEITEVVELYNQNARGTTRGPKAAENRTLNSLYGKTVTPHDGYKEFEISAWKYISDIMYTTVTPGDRGEISNFELVSNGPFYITMLGGYEGSQQHFILGYYTHSPATYDNLHFTDLTETHYYDYLANPEDEEYLAKVQYQLDNIDKWYDANFDYKDGFDGKQSIRPERRDDDAYNTLLVAQHYGDRVTRFRGLSFKVDVPERTRIGFFLRMDDEENSEQRQRLIDQGLPADKLPLIFKETNFTAEAFNVDGRYRSFLVEQGGFTFIGLEDTGILGDYDCNDVMFGITARMDYEMPGVVIPELENIDNNYELLPWTLAFEDVYRDKDFDFNDVVIRIEPDYVKEKAIVTLCAAGAKNKMFLHYDGPEGDVMLGEVHELFGTEHGRVVNTTSSMPTVAERVVAEVPWPVGYTMAKDAARFYVAIQRNNCTDCEDILSLSTTPGLLPQALLVAGKWGWPKEGNAITEVYSDFARWAADCSKLAYWNWFSYPRADKYVMP